MFWCIILITLLHGICTNARNLSPMEQILNVNEANHATDDKIETDEYHNANDEKSEETTGTNSRKLSPMDQILKVNEENHALDDKIETDEYPNANDEKSEATTEFKRNAVYDYRYLWKTRKVPFAISNSFSWGEKTAIYSAIGALIDVSCIRFHRKTATDTDYLDIVKEVGCGSFVGKQSTGPQKVSIGAGCLTKGIIMHELLHALGFYHEQSRYDRDKFVTIHWENIRPGYAHDFEKKTNSQNSGTEYDYDGIMHYGKFYFSKNGKETITVTALGKGAKIGNRGDLSTIDIKQLNSLYSCSSANTVGETWSQWAYAACDATKCQKVGRRFCTKDSCSGPEEHTVICADQECKIDGGYTNWISWSTCTKTCGGGDQFRTRTCTKPDPKNGGKDCSSLGAARVTQVCNSALCKVQKQEYDLGNTNWGEWKPTISCPKGVKVNGFRLQVAKDYSQYSWWDNSALNGIQLSCANGKITEKTYGYTGNWKSWRKCESGEYVEGFNFRSQKDQGYGDNMAGTDVKMQCNKRNAQDGRELYGDGLDFGTWSSSTYLKCAPGSYFCGLQAKVQLKRYWGTDGTGLNRIKFICCV